MRLIAFLGSQAILSKHDILQISLSASRCPSLRAGGALFSMLFGVFCLALGAIVRNTAGGIARSPPCSSSSRRC